MARSVSKESDRKYWREYTNLQSTKHALIKCYLDGWLPKLGSWAGRVLYLDTHAGRGRHRGGEHGSPLVAVKAALEHRHRASVFGRCEIVYFFVEIDEENASALEEEIDALGKLPDQIHTEIVVADCYEALTALVEDIRESKNALAPAFVFVDPYGFKVPGRLLRELMSFERVELFVNVIWRELSMAIAQADSSPGMAETLDTVFDGIEWRDLIGLEFEAQAHACTRLFRNMIGAKWATYIQMLGPNNVTRYMLLHLTNHDAGRDLMKDCMWKVSPLQPFVARVSEDPTQQFLIKPEPDLSPLRQWVLSVLSSNPAHWLDLVEQIRSKVWREKQLNDTIRQLRREGKIGYRGAERFAKKNNPELYVVTD